MFVKTVYMTALGILILSSQSQSISSAKEMLENTMSF
jgi:hypothetical protein